MSARVVSVVAGSISDSEETEGGPELSIHSRVTEPELSGGQFTFSSADGKFDGMSYPVLL